MCEGQLQYLNQNYDASADRFREAVSADASFLPAYMGLLNSLYQMGWHGWGDTTESATILTSFAQAVESMDPEAIDIVRVYRSAFEAQAGNIDDAVTTIGAVLGIE